jgi:hypothetical protein
MHTVMMYGGLLAASAGEAAFYIDSCPQMSVFTWTGEIRLLAALAGCLVQTGGRVGVPAANSVQQTASSPQQRVPAAKGGNVQQKRHSPLGGRGATCMHGLNLCCCPMPPLPHPFPCPRPLPLAPCLQRSWRCCITSCTRPS